MAEVEVMAWNHTCHDLSTLTPSFLTVVPGETQASAASWFLSWHSWLHPAHR